MKACKANCVGQSQELRSHARPFVSSYFDVNLVRVYYFDILLIRFIAICRSISNSPCLLRNFRMILDCSIIRIWLSRSTEFLFYLNRRSAVRRWICWHKCESSLTSFAKVAINLGRDELQGCGYWKWPSRARYLITLICATRTTHHGFTSSARLCTRFVESPRTSRRAVHGNAAQRKLQRFSLCKSPVRS